MASFVMKSSCVINHTSKSSRGVRLQSRRPASTFRKSLVVRAADVEVSETMGDNSRLLLTVKVPKEICDTCYTQVLADVSKEAQIPGFRKGKKLSTQLLVQHYGLKNVRAAVVESVLHKTMKDAIAKVAERALDESEKIETAMDDLLGQLSGPDGKPVGDLEYVIGMDMVPEIKFTGDYKAITVEVEAAGDAASIEREAAKEYDSLIKDKFGVLRVETERGLKRGDIGVLALKANKVNEDGSDGEVIEGVNNDNFRFDTSQGEGFLPGLVEKVIGMKVGETSLFEITFPDNWFVASMQGVKGRFVATLKELFYTELPALTDDRARELMTDCNSFAEVKAAITQRWEQDVQAATDRRISEAITDEIAALVDTKLPKSLIQDQGRQNYSTKLWELMAQGGISKDVLETLLTEDMVQDYIEKHLDEVERVVKLTMGVNEIQKLENIVVDQAELDAEVASSKLEFEKQGQEFDEEKLIEQAQELLEGAKVLEFLKQNCNVTVKPYSGS